MAQSSMKDSHTHYYAVILAGGGGTRLWPKSREETPKQFLKLAGEKTMVQIAADRITSILPWEKIIVVTNQKYKKEISRQLPLIPKQNIIGEPQKKETAMAMLVGAIYAQNLDPNAVIMNVASDHVVTNDSEYVRVISKALAVAETEDYLVSIGISPTEPNTGFGYIKAGIDLHKLDHGLSLFKVESFTEKPNLATARAYISTGKYFWNANMYVWSATNIMNSFAKYMPQMLKIAKPLLGLSYSQFHRALPKIYDQCEKIAIDYAISEKADNLVLIPGDFGWSDVGNWKIVYDLGEKNQDQNVIVSDTKQNNTIAIESKYNLLHTDKRLVALMGINEMVVIDTPEILLVMPKNRSQDVKQIIDKIKQEKKEQYL